MIEKIEREPDESQHASNLEQAERDIGLEAIRKQMAAKPPADFDGENCVPCGLEIHPGRLALGKWTCIVCQDRIDKRNKQRGI